MEDDGDEVSHASHRRRILGPWPTAASMALIASPSAQSRKVRFCRPSAFDGIAAVELAPDRGGRGHASVG